MATIPTYRDLEDRIEVLEGKLKFWSNLARLEPDASDEWDDERMDIIGQNGNDGLHYNTDKEGM